MLSVALDTVVYYNLYHAQLAKMNKQYTVKKLADMVGVKIETIRFYENESLLPKPKRAANGYRIYDDSTLHRLKFIVNAKSLGFTLNEIRDLLKLAHVSKIADVHEARKITQSKINDIKGRIEKLEKIVVALDGMYRKCQKKGRAHHCPIIEALTQ